VSGGDFLVSLRRDRGLRRLFLVGLVLAVTDMSAYWFTYSWMPAYLYDKLHFSMARSGVWMICSSSLPVATSSRSTIGTDVCTSSNRTMPSCSCASVSWN